MPLYRYRPDANNFAGIVFEAQEDGRVTDVHYTDDRLVSEWEPPTAHVFDEDDYGEEESGIEGDFPSLTNYYRIPVVSERAWEVLKPLIGDVSEPLPIVYPDGKPYFLLHVMNTIDALDQERSRVRRSKIGDCRIMQIYIYAFKEEMLSSQHIFKLPLESAAELFVDDEFRRTVEENGLKGLLFDPLPMAEPGRVRGR